MRKTWTTLIVLGILLCMFVSIGANAQAAEDALTILAVDGDVLTDEQIAALKNEYSNGYILDVSGEGTNSGLDIIFTESHPVEMGALIPESGEHKTEPLYLGDPMTLEANGEKITLIGVNAELDAGTIGMLLEGAEGKIVAVGKAEAGQAVKEAGIDLFLTTDSGDGVQTMVTANVGVTQIVNVGVDSAWPITKVTLDWEGNLQAEPIAVPEDMTMVEPGPAVEEPAPDQPVQDQPAQDQPAADAVFNVWYDRNGAEEGVVYDTQVSESNPLVLPENGYNHYGYTFAGWNYNGNIYQPGDSIYLSGDATIYAAWDPVVETEVYDVTFNANGAESGSMEDTQVTAGNAFELPANGYAREGYEFTGWDVNGSVYQPYETASISADTTVYAQWEAVSVAPVVYNVWFDANGAEGGSMEATQVTEGNAFELPENGYTYTGYNFTGWNVNGSVYQPHETVTITADTTVYASWEQAPAESVSYTLTYEPGEGTGEAYTATGTQLTLDESPFTAPEGKHFASWSINGAPYDAGAAFELTADAAAVATYEADGDTAATAQDPGLQNGSDMRTWKHGGTDALFVSFANAKVDTVAVGPMDAMTQTLDTSSYTVTDYNTTGSTVTLTKEYLDSLTVGNSYFMEFRFKTSADGVTYEPVMLMLHINEADAQDAGIQNGTDMRTWKQGGTDNLAISFANAKVATITVAPEGSTGATLTAGSQFTVSNFGDNGQTVTFVKTYLDSLTANTTYNVSFTFADANGLSYEPISVKLHVTPADPVVTPEQNRKETWNRAYELPLTFDGRTPSGLQIRFGADNWVNGTNNTDYRLNGSTITLLPAMVNGGSRWQSWGNGGYTFRVSFTSGDPVEVSVTLEGTAPVSQTQPTATPEPGSTAAPQNLGPTAPVTGDETPIVLYVVILVLLVAALAIVIILLTKKNRGRR